MKPINSKSKSLSLKLRLAINLLIVLALTLMSTNVALAADTVVATHTPSPASTSEDTPITITLIGDKTQGNNPSSCGAWSFSITSGPTNGTLGAISPPTCPVSNKIAYANVVFTPASNYTGTGTFTFSATTGGTTGSQSVSISITPVNDPPVITEGNSTSVPMSEDGSPTAFALTLNATDPELNTLTWSISTPATHGTATASGTGASKAIGYAPDANYNGSDSFAVQVSDGNGGTDTITVNVTIQAVNDAPVANAQSLSTPLDTVVGVTLSGSDVDGDLLTFSVVTSPSHGTLDGDPPYLTYTPNPGNSDPDSFTYKANDGTVDSATDATVNITIAANDPPTADNQSVSTAEDTALAITLTGSDPNGDALLYSVVSPPANGALSGGGQNLVYTPAANYNGPDSFTFKVNDGHVDSAPAAVSITVTPVNDPPSANAQSVLTPIDTALGITLSGNDIDSDSLTFNVTSGPSHGTLTGGTGAGRTYTPTTGYFGPDSFQFVTNDGTVDSAPATVSILVEEVALSLPFVDNFESNLGWLVNPSGSDSASSGQWQRADPQPTDASGAKQLDASSPTFDLVTGALAGANANSFDVDGGVTSIQSPLLKLPSGQISLAFQYYFAHGQNATSADFLRVKVVGNSTVTVLELLGSSADVDAEWKSASLNLSSFAGQKVRILIEAADNAKNSLVEAAVDDLSVTAIVPPPTELVNKSFNSNEDGFLYQDDAFRGTAQPGYASGVWSASGGVSGGGLQVSLGGLDNDIVTDISGGYMISFNLASAATVKVQFWYKLTQSSEYEAEECSQALVSLEGTLYGAGSNDTITQICGNGNGGSNETSGWQLFSFEVPLAAGDNELVIGGYNNQKSWDNEWTEVLIDEVLVTTP